MLAFCSSTTALLQVCQTSRPFYSGAHHTGEVGDFDFALEKPAANLLIRLCTTKGTEVARAIVDVKLLRDGTWAMWCLAEDGGVQAERWVAGSDAWEVRVRRMTSKNALHPQSRACSSSPERR